MSDTPLRRWVAVVGLVALAVVGCSKKESSVSRFISSDTRAYLEISDGNQARKLFTEYGQNYMGILVLDEANNPLVLKFAFSDAAKTQNVWTTEFTRDDETTSPSARLVESEYLRTLNSASPEFEAWKKRFVDFPTAEPDYTHRLSRRIDTSANPSGGGLNIVEGEVIARSIKDWLCHCRNGGISSWCVFNSALRCQVDNLCDVYSCIEKGEWTGECNVSLQKAKACAGLSE